MNYSRSKEGEVVNSMTKKEEERRKERRREAQEKKEIEDRSLKFCAQKKVSEKDTCLIIGSIDHASLA
jgi:hypothetical protein